MHHKWPHIVCRGISCILCPCLFLSGLAGGQARAAGPEMYREEASMPARPAAARSNEPRVLVPEAPGTATIGAEPLLIDVSNASQGYIMARYTGAAAKVGIQIIGPDGITYKYFMPPSEEYMPLPLTSGSGSYMVEGYENVVDNRYATLYKEPLEVALEDELLPFLYPNQYVFFTPETEAVDVAAEVVADAEDDIEAVADIYHYVVENVTYDEEKAATVPSGYLPDVDETLRTGKGICFDYAALTVTMLRSQNIPAKLEIGYSGTIYHAWISVYIPEIGWIDKLIEFTGDAWTRMDPTFASGNNNSDAILKYIGDGSNYSLQYSH